jgi:hypothetical protein
MILLQHPGGIRVNIRLFPSLESTLKLNRLYCPAYIHALIMLCLATRLFHMSKYLQFYENVKIHSDFLSQPRCTCQAREEDASATVP